VIVALGLCPSDCFSIRKEFPIRSWGLNTGDGKTVSAGLDSSILCGGEFLDLTTSLWMSSSPGNMLARRLEGTVNNMTSICGEYFVCKCMTTVFRNTYNVTTTFFGFGGERNFRLKVIDGFPEVKM
jgi:hypothetical protein